MERTYGILDGKRNRDKEEYFRDRKKIWKRWRNRSMGVHEADTKHVPANSVLWAGIHDQGNEFGVKLQITINDTIRSILRAPTHYANKILYAETGFELMEIRCRAAERKGYARHIKYEYGKVCPWFGCIADKWTDDHIQKHKTVSNKVRKKKPVFDIERDKTKAIKNHSIGWDDNPKDELWVYTNGSKKEKEAGIA